MSHGIRKQMLILKIIKLTTGKQPGSGNGDPHRDGPDRMQLRLQQQDTGLHEVGCLEEQHGADIGPHSAAAGKHSHHS